MTLDDAQKKKVAGWIAEGAKLSEIQTRLDTELGLKLTYMDVRFLVDDLKLTPKDSEPPKPPATPTSPTVPPGAPPAPGTPKAADAKAIPAGAGTVSVAVDQLARAGAVVSGKVTFSDGNQAEWYFDQSGRLGLAPVQTGYRPSPADLQKFQTLLEAELAKMGY